jgi:threonine synthase
VTGPVAAGAEGPVATADPGGVADPAGAAPFPAPVVCAGCGWRARDTDAFPIRCAAATPGDDTDHVMTRVLDAAAPVPADGDANPFIRYRTLFHAWHAARRAGWSDDRYVDLVRGLDAAVATVDGHGFTVTPFARS